MAALTDPLGRTVRYTYDGSGRLATVTDPAGGVTSYTYDSAHRLLTITDPRGITFLRNEYDGSGRVSRQIQADGGTWTFAYTLTSGVVTEARVTDPRGNPTTSRFNTQGYLLSQSDALGQMTIYERQPGTNLLLSTTDPLGRKASFEYDTMGNVTRLTDPSGAVTQYAYEATFNQLTQVIKALRQITTYDYDAAGNLISVTDERGTLLSFTYDSQGLVTRVVDLGGRSTSFEYNPRGDLVAATDSRGASITNTYDSLSRLIEATDASGKVTHYTYDGLDRPIAGTGPLGTTATGSFDSNGGIVEVVDPGGHRYQFTYDAMGHLTTRIDPAGRREEFTYDLTGNLVRAVSRRGQSTTLNYDPLNRLRRLTFADGTTIDYVYDAVGNLVQATDSVAGTITRSYDALGQLLSEATPQGTVSATYDLLGRRTQLQVSGETPVAYQYDPLGRLARISTGSPSGNLAYDPLGRRTSLSFSNGVRTTYEYDAGSNLAALSHQLPTGVFQDLRFTYDSRGLRTSVAGRPGAALLPDPITVAPANALNQYTLFGTLSLLYDEDGHLTGLTGPSGTTIFTWDARGQLATILGPGVKATFAYDAFGRRVRKTVNGSTSAFLYDGLDIVQEIRDGVPVTYLRGPDLDEVWARTERGLTQFYLSDELGSTVALTDTSGAVQTQYIYGPFGATELSGSPSPNPFQYTGRENDGTGLYYFRNRYYSPMLGRFISEDPLSFLGGIHAYAYANNSPCTFIDPLGLGPCRAARFTEDITGWGGRTFTAADLNYGLALVYAEQTPSWRRSTPRRLPGGHGFRHFPITLEARFKEAHGIVSSLLNRLGQPRFNYDRSGRELPRPQTLHEVIDAYTPKNSKGQVGRQFAGVGNSRFTEATADRPTDCVAHDLAFFAVLEGVTLGPTHEFDSFRAVVQKNATFVRDLRPSDTNYAGTDFFKERK